MIRLAPWILLAALPSWIYAAPGNTPVIDGTGLATGELSGLVYIEDGACMQVVGFEIRNYTASSSSDFPAGIWVLGRSNHVEIRDNVVHHIATAGCGNCGAHGIAVYGTSAADSIHDLVIDGNTVRDCTLAAPEPGTAPSSPHRSRETTRVASWARATDREPPALRAVPCVGAVPATRLGWRHTGRRANTRDSDVAGGLA